MARLLFLLVIFTVVAMTYLFMEYAKYSYRLIPITKEVNPKDPPSTWIDFQAPSGKFEAKFPAKPQQARQKLVDPKTKQVREYDMYVAESSVGSIYMVSLITFSDVDTPTEQTDLLTSVMNNMLESSKTNVLKAMNMGTYKGHESLDFSIQNGDVEIHAKAFIADKILYALTSVTKQINSEPTEFKYFVDSFKLKPEINLSPK